MALDDETYDPENNDVDDNDADEIVNHFATVWKSIIVAVDFCQNMIERAINKSVSSEEFASNKTEKFVPFAQLMIEELVIKFLDTFNPNQANYEKSSLKFLNAFKDRLKEEHAITINEFSATADDDDGDERLLGEMNNYSDNIKKDINTIFCTLREKIERDVLVEETWKEAQKCILPTDEYADTPLKELEKDLNRLKSNRLLNSCLDDEKENLGNSVGMKQVRLVAAVEKIEGRMIERSEELEEKTKKKLKSCFPEGSV
eukprot:CAMPEP_0194075228 /NCGR_PEP_ID=MMETSP0149-20130528/2257_1 /TAXON_ID=122233 /ORGANISM="Chaetoceros debilis, Strain MM31A-1" /LENGTH=258 /DNA_ID=CAMNT_0038755637 /DNA_START=751 /DNA_END=1527 /DNA_ORIENTATION=-